MGAGARVSDLVVGDDGLARCPWGASAPEYVAYHDTEWGRPRRGDDAMFERLTLEAFQSGLSWLTILRKREAFRAAFDGFSIQAVARFGDRDVERLMADAGIVRNRAKITATVANARVAAGLPEGLSALLWSFQPLRATVPRCLADVPAATAESTALAQELKRRGFRFVGPTTAYALMQAVGMVNDHLEGCHARSGGIETVGNRPATCCRWCHRTRSGRPGSPGCGPDRGGTPSTPLPHEGYLLCALSQFRTLHEPVGRRMKGVFVRQY